MAKRAYRWVWTARINQDSLPELQRLAEGLGFLVTAPGGFFGEPSAPALLDALAAAHRADPGGTALALKVILRENGLLPARPPSDKTAGPNP